MATTLVIGTSLLHLHYCKCPMWSPCLCLFPAARLWSFEKASHIMGLLWEWFPQWLPSKWAKEPKPLLRSLRLHGSWLHTFLWSPPSSPCSLLQPRCPSLCSFNRSLPPPAVPLCLQFPYARILSPDVHMLTLSAPLSLLTIS